MVSDQKARAHRHVTKARDIVARQRDLIAGIRARGGERGKMEDLLSVFERSLAIFEDDLAAITKEQTPA
jgi:hypothetical protein